MSEVKRYEAATLYFPDGGFWKSTTRKSVVMAADYDASQSELAALREELAKFDEGMRALACSLGSGGYNAETLTADQLVGKVQWGIDHLLGVHEKRLAAAEQRNAELVELLNGYPRGVPGFAAWADKVTAALNPTESGASE